MVLASSFIDAYSFGLTTYALLCRCYPYHGRAGQIQDDDGPKNELLRNGQPIEDDGYDNPGMASLTLLRVYAI